MEERMTLKTEYKGYEIEYSEWDEKFKIKGSDEQSSSLKSLKETIDKIEQQKNKVDKLKVIFMESYPAKFIDAEITSVADDTHVWISYNKKRGKENLERIYRDNKLNRELLLKLEDLQKERKVIIDKIDKLIEEEMEKITIAEIRPLGDGADNTG